MEKPYGDIGFLGASSILEKVSPPPKTDEDDAKSTRASCFFAKSQIFWVPTTLLKNVYLGSDKLRGTEPNAAR